MGPFKRSIKSIFYCILGTWFIFIPLLLNLYVHCLTTIKEQSIEIKQVLDIEEQAENTSSKKIKLRPNIRNFTIPNFIKIILKISKQTPFNFTEKKFSFFDFGYKKKYIYHKIKIFDNQIFTCLYSIFYYFLLLPRAP